MGWPFTNLWTAMIKLEILSGKYYWKANRASVFYWTEILFCILNMFMVSFYSLVLLPAVPFSLSVLWDSSHIFSRFAFLSKTSLFHLFSTYKIDCHSPAERHCKISSRTMLLSSTGWVCLAGSVWIFMSINVG